MIRNLKNRYAEVRMLQVGNMSWHWMDFVYLLTGWVPR
jgi:hypothetical protein